MSTSVSETPLERSLDREPSSTPLDALRVARETWLADGRLDMGALAAALGTSRATLYRWVGSRERLLGEVMWSLAESSYQRALEQTAGAGPDYIADVIELYMRSAIESVPLRRFIERDPEYALRVMASKHSPMQRRSIAATRQLLAEQQRVGALEPPLDLDTLAYLIVRIVESFLYADVITGDEPDIEKAADAIHTLLSAPAPKRRRRPARRATGS